MIRRLVLSLFLMLLVSAGSVSALPTQVHTIIAHEAALLPAVPAEVRSYLGNPESCLFHFRDTICEGTYDEDADIDPHMESDDNSAWLGMFNSGTHLWNPDGGPARGLLEWVGAIPVNRDHENAYQRALGLYRAALDRYPDDPPTAYYLLGRAAHLLGDMATPAHVHLDPHISDRDSTGDDSYEEFLADLYSYHGKLAGRLAFEEDFPRSAISLQSAGDLPSEGFEETHLLFRLFLSLARLSQRFDSDDSEGTFDRGSRQGRSIVFSGGLPYSVSVVSGGGESPLAREYYRLSPARGKLVLPETVYQALLAAEPPVAGIRLGSAGGSEICQLASFSRTDIGDEDLAAPAATLMPAAVAHVAGLYRLFWEEAHPGLRQTPPGVSFNRGVHELRLHRPSPLSIEIDIDTGGWLDREVEVYLWADAPLPGNRLRRFFDGEWHDFFAFGEMRPLAATLRLSPVSGLVWTPLEDTTTLPDFHFTLSICLDDALDEALTPDRAVCGALLVIVTGELQ